MAAGAEILRFQAGCALNNCYDFGNAAAVTDDWSSFIAGVTWGEWNGATSAITADFAVIKFNSSGTLEWFWQDGSDGKDFLVGAAAVSDGAVVAAGYTNGTSWNGVPGLGETDFAVVKLNTDGTVAWTWQGGTESDDVLWTCSKTVDGNVVVGGYTLGSWAGISNGYNNIAAAKIDVGTGATLWEFQAGTANGGGAYAYGASARSDGSVVLVGRTFGEFNDMALKPNGSSPDFIAVAVDENGTELWRWQDGTGSGFNWFEGVAALDDNSVVLAGGTQGDWDGELIGGTDFAVVKLSSLGVEEWRWQGGTTEVDEIDDAVTGADGSVILTGYTKGSWAAEYAGGFKDDSGDFVALGLDADGTLLWTYQAGTAHDDAFTTAAVREDGTVLLAGWTNGVWEETDDFDQYMDFAAVFLDPDVLLNTGIVFATPAPEIVATTPQPTHMATPEPVLSPVAEKPDTAPPGLTEPTNTSSSSGTPLAPVVGGVAGAAAILLLLGILLIRRNRQSSAVKASDNSMSAARGFPQAASTSTGGNADVARGYRQSVARIAGTSSTNSTNRQAAAPAAGVTRAYLQSATAATGSSHAYQQSAALGVGAGHANPRPPSYFEVVPRASDTAAVTLSPPPPYNESAAYIH